MPLLNFPSPAPSPRSPRQSRCSSPLDVATDQRYVSNELSHFVGRSLTDPEARYQLLMQILNEGRLLARPPPTDPDASGYSINKAVNFSSGERYGSMVHVCFCDIPEQDLSYTRRQSTAALASRFRSRSLLNGVRILSSISRDSLRSSTWRLVLSTSTTTSVTDRIQQVLRERGTRETSPGSREWCDATDQLASYVLSFCEGSMLLFIKWFDADIADDDLENVYMERAPNGVLLA